MQYKAEQKYVKMTPRKLRLVAGMVKGLTPSEAVEMLPYVRKAAAEPLRKVIKAAIANAKERGVKEEELVFGEIQVGDGPRLKRGRPVSRGQWHPVLKRWSHIRLVLTTKSQIVNSKSQVNSNDRISKQRKRAGERKFKNKATLEKNKKGEKK